MTTIAKGNKRIPPGGTNKEVNLADKVTIPKLATKAYEGNPQDADGHGKASTPSTAFLCGICGPCKAFRMRLEEERVRLSPLRL